jgi:hypothetical protein
MGKFEKGHKLATGRPKGALNRSTEEMKLTIARAVNNTLSTISSDLQEIKKDDPIAAVNLALKLLEYTLPKMRSVDVKGSMEIDQRIQQITVNINKTGSESNN